MDHRLWNWPLKARGEALPFQALPSEAHLCTALFRSLENGRPWRMHSMRLARRAAEEMQRLQESALLQQEVPSERLERAQAHVQGTIAVKLIWS